VRRLPARAALVASLPLLAAGARAAHDSGELMGRVVLRDARGTTAPVADAAVWLPGVRDPNPLFDERPAIVQKGKRFEPHVLLVPKGTRVAFPNLDTVFHNVFSLTPGNQFDLGLDRGGASREATFGAAGVVRVYCNIHPGMAAYVIVVDGASYAATRADGSYRIGGIPPGAHSVRVWHERAGEREENVEIRAGESTTLDLALDGSAYRDAPHKNKYGEDYRPADADRY
jgi:plastocyanin